jgi:glycosyltransferase involved in cell wall biosynthesis
MKIGVITSAYPEFPDDPHGIFVHRLMREVSNQGHDVHILAPYTGGKTEFNLEGVHVEKFNYFYPKRYQRLAGRSGMIDNVKEGFFVKLQFLSFIFFNVVNSCWKLNDVDIVHVQWPIPNGLGALFLKKLYKIDYINTVHGEEVYLSKRYHTTPIIKLLVNNSLKTITNSTATLKACLDEGFQKDKLERIPFGVDTNFFRPINVDKDKKTFQILTVGYLIERKGFKYLIEAMKEVLKKHENVKLKIVGSGPLEKPIKKLIKELKLESTIEIISNVPDDGLLELYNLSDLFVLPSIVDTEGNTEGLGVVLLEAMACKLPVIGSNIGGIPDIVHDGVNGFLVPEKDSEKISIAIMKLIENHDMRENFAINGYEMVKGYFSWDLIAKEYINIYSTILKEHE